MQKQLITALALSLSACALDGETDSDGLASTAQSVTNWSFREHGTTTDTVGFDTGLSTASWKCVLAEVAGHLSSGGYWYQDYGDVPAEAGIDERNGHWIVQGHGGAYANQVNQTVWDNVPVIAGAACVPYTSTANGGSWTSERLDDAAPVKIAALATNRRCFLQGIQASAGTLASANDTISVVPITTPDSTHSTTGWYLQGTARSDQGTNNQVIAWADCIDFPTIAGEWTNSWTNGSENVTQNGDSHAKMCGLTGIRGGFTVDSWTDGAKAAPNAAASLWNLTVSANKRAWTDCIE